LQQAYLKPKVAKIYPLRARKWPDWTDDFVAATSAKYWAKVASGEPLWELLSPEGVIVDSSRNPTLRRSGRGWASLPQPISLCYLGGGLAEQGPWNVDQRESSSLLWQFVGVGFDDDLNSFFAGVDFDPHGAVFKIDFVPAARFAADNGMGHLWAYE
jgi:hypothetical protein